MRTLFIVLAILISVSAQALNMKEVEYVRHEPHYDPEKTKASILVFVYDIPYLSACGIFPPFHILNETFLEGGSQGGMSPGATWDPFSITRDSYEQLWELIETTDPTLLKSKARYAQVKFIRDDELEIIEYRFKWAKRACDKHRDEFMKKQKKAFGI